MDIKRITEHPIFESSQLLLLWVLIATIMLPSVIRFLPVALLFCASTSNLFYSSPTTNWKSAWTIWAGFFAFLLVGIAFSHLPEKSIKGGYDIVRFLVLFIFITPLIVERSDETIAKSLNIFSLIVGLLFFTVVLVVQLSEGSLFIRDSMIGYEFWGSHNLLSTGVTIFFVLTLSTISTKSVSKAPGIFALLLLAYCMVFILSRGNLLAASCVGLFLIFYHYKFLYRYLFFLFVIFFAVYIYAFFILNCKDISCDFVLYPRQHLYQSTLDFIYAQPLTGYGLSVFKIISGIQEGGVNVIMPHNLILELFYSVGIIGSFVFITTLMAWFYKSGWTFSLLIRSDKLPLPIIIGTSLFIYLFIRGLFDLKLVSSQTFGLLAIIYALFYSRSPQPETSPASKA
ncbi:MAG: O-antigen ligase family protein [Gammaproteobacteria bacterium]|nr:O-antigen ligase family protein [Gammaproteobacteria bacterium]